jgi:hypothetical protein
MGGDSSLIEELTREIAALSADARDRLLARFVRQPTGRPIPPSWRPPLIKGIPADSIRGMIFSREELYGDDGR